MNAKEQDEIKHKTEGVGWFCIRSQRKREAVAAACLRAFEGVEAFNPSLRYRKLTRRGAAWITEPLFPSYLFARFNLHLALARVRSARGVSGIVHFGSHHPHVPDEVIEELRRFFGEAEILQVPLDPAVGQTIELAGGAFHGLEAVIMRVMPAQERIQVLMDFMGRQTVVEVGLNAVVPPKGRHLTLT